MQKPSSTYVRPPRKRKEVMVPSASNFINFLIMMSFVTSSFDIFANITIAGSNIRIFNVLELIIILLSTIIVINFKLINILIYFCLFLFSFCAINFLSTIIYQDNNLKSISYEMWLILNSIFVISGIFIGSQLVTIELIIYLYLKAFIVVALIGFVQLVLGVFSISFMTTEWWIEGRLPRLNGFAYEPSYYATYLLTGFGLAAELWRLGPLRFQRLARFTTISTGIMIVLSSSRIGIIFLCLYMVYAGVANFVSRPGLVIRRGFHIAFTLLPIVLVVGVIGLPDSNFDIFLAGTGINNTAAHSVDARDSLMSGTYQTWLNNPMIGVGLGNVGKAVYLAVGRSVDPQVDIVKYTGMNITLEMLAGTGLIGFCTFSMFLTFLFVLLKRALKFRGMPPQLHWSLLLSFLLLVGILQFNQNVLRSYLWTHLFLIAAIIGYCYGSGVETMSRLARRRGLMNSDAKCNTSAP